MLWWRVRFIFPEMDTLAIPLSAITFFFTICRARYFSEVICIMFQGQDSVLGTDNLCGLIYLQGVQTHSWTPVVSSKIQR